MNLERLDSSQQFNLATRLDTYKVDALASILSQACYKEPNITYLIPDVEARRILRPWLFVSVIRAGQLYGEITQIEDGRGAAVWISPLYDVSLSQVVRAALRSMPFAVERRIARVCMKMAATVQDVRRRLAPIPHWYLIALGAESRREKAIGERLIEPVLLRADSAGTPCYLETFTEEGLRFYESYGFRIAGAGRIPGGGPNFWALMRAPGEFGKWRCLLKSVP